MRTAQAHVFFQTFGKQILTSRLISTPIKNIIITKKVVSAHHQHSTRNLTTVYKRSWTIWHTDRLNEWVTYVTSHVTTVTTKWQKIRTPTLLCCFIFFDCAMTLWVRRWLLDRWWSYICYARQLHRQVLLRARISYRNSVCPSVRPSRPGTDSRPGQIETPGLHHMIA